MAIADVQQSGKKNKKFRKTDITKGMFDGLDGRDCNDMPNQTSFLLESIKDSLDECPSDLMIYSNIMYREHGEEVKHIINDYAFYYSQLKIYEDVIASNIGKTIVNKKLNKIFSADVSLMVGNQKLPMINNGLKAVVKDSLISGSALLIVDEDSNDFMKCKFKSIPAYRYYKEHILIEDTDNYIDKFYVYTVTGDDVYKTVRTYDSSSNVTTIEKSVQRGKHDFENLGTETFNGILQYEFSNIDTYSDINNVKELILGFDISLTSIYKNTKTALPKLHIDREFESTALNDEDITIVYDIPTREDGVPFFKYESSSFIGNDLWDSTSKILSLICSTTGLSEEILGFENLAEVKSTTTVYEDDKTAETINALKTHYAYFINEFFKLYKSGVTITLGIYNKQSLELRSKTANTLMASVKKKMEYVFPEATPDDLLWEVCRYKFENNIELTVEEEEFNNKNNVFVPIVEEVIDPMAKDEPKPETIKKQNANNRKKSTGSDRILDN